MSRLAQRQVYSNGRVISLSLSGDLGYMEIEDRRLFPDEDSRTDRRDRGYHKLGINGMTRKDLKDLKTAIKEVLKNSK